MSLDRVDTSRSLDARGASSNVPLCELRGVSQSFAQPHGAPLLVLEDVSLQVQPNEVVCLLGPSGCGKSTVLRILAGLLRPTRGEVLYRGRPLQGLNPGVAIVFQSFALYPWMTVEQNVEVVLKAAGLGRDEVAARVSQSIRKVGLEGFERAHPRELSGGMKQRVGMARAFSLDPELLFMDEPFSQVDALTAESLRAEVLDIWSAKDKHASSILMVSHDIKEVVYMADRIVVLGAHPGVVRTVVENRLPRPRDYRSPELLRLVDRLHDIITGHELPDTQEPSTPVSITATPVEPLPDASGGELVGLLEYLDARGGREELFRIAADTDQEFGKVINVVKAAEMLDFVDTPKRMVLLSACGVRFLQGDASERKRLWREQLLHLGLFRKVWAALVQQPRKELDRELVLDLIVLSMPSEDYERIFDTLARWARFGELFTYDENRGVLLLS
ncbi:nitrate/sulfonate/bicarbonate ABC transporter ATP-binding protein [Corallococcus exiguus]|uniref:ABC transporter ATP-binding protein n=1 Tax=Corallococcus TaxID=83461 RepID=UPI000EDF0B57|nr:MULTISPECIES: nitrate/sulfonate/bicarbonate ABC transporter ATP-binding protein [Corallococcus]NNB84752.1 nitrate/sulfonate/bicarbonate ABC transporter ATP-binding protein [Corallococcus exiguus]NNB94409.1 nitrate/sulfonate/bicarbonate ABC transporter ATP-binding protein [Corallococcus exiguus]NNC03030.1 nitrate/sulfonate/bicarbonate ABC transporter ATP-binding protein [Corallococcus exiguus]NPC45766.1 nitrate/sulfonate/bicarbonate ABC transporter ATP-binding protein [Corallococcus exiguus]